MKPFFSNGGRRQRGGFSLVEATFSIGLMSFGFLTMAPLLSVGLKTARGARDDRATAQIAQTLVQEAEQGTLPAGAVYFDSGGANCGAAQAAYTAQSTTQLVAGSPALTQVALRVVPLGAPERARTYAVVFQSPQ
jgi:uncharacterized protein (TIGR02598 family)